MPSRRRLAVLPVIAALLAVLAASLAPAAAQERPFTVFAAASLKNALDAVNAVFEARGGPKVMVSYAASSALARQIEGGIPADIFISADIPWMDHVAERKLIKASSRWDLLGNQIVLIAPRESKVELRIEKGFGLRAALGADGRLAMGNIDAVPAGRYGKAALEALGVWRSVADRVAQAENVRMALTLVSRGEAPLGIVYRTDAASDPSVRMVGVFPDGTHPPIVYPMALLSTSTNPDAQAFVDFLKSPKARSSFEKQGFSLLK